MTELDIVIPVYNEGRNIIDVLDAKRRSVKTPYRVLICYDFDEDDTLAALHGYPRDVVDIVLIKSTGRGPHDAIVAGFRASTAPAVLVYPADDYWNADRLDAMVKLVRQGCDIVCASRFIPGGSMVNCPLVKAMLVHTAAFTLYHCARVPSHDPTHGFRIFSRRVVDGIEIQSSKGFALSMELLVKVHRLGWKVAEVPTIWEERGEGQGKSRFRAFRWMPSYLRWYFYAFVTTYLFRGAGTVSVNKTNDEQALL